MRACALCARVCMRARAPLSNDYIISRQRNVHFQNCIVIAFPMKSSVVGRFSSLPPRPTPSKERQTLFLVISHFLTGARACACVRAHSCLRPCMRVWVCAYELICTKAAAPAMRTEEKTFPRRCLRTEHAVADSYLPQATVVNAKTKQPGHRSDP